MEKIYKNLERIAQRTYENTRSIRQDNNQRRHQVVDLYGVEYTRQGDSANPAQFYISISPDMVYLERFEFKLIVQPFVSYVNGTESKVVTVNDTSLTVSNNSITPNPHKHTTESHNHNLSHGISLTHTTASDFGVWIEGVNVTPYLAAQFDAWIEGEGVYPSIRIGQDYDVLQVACDLVAEGREDEAERLIHPGYKEVVITSNAPFQITLVNYLKYSHLNR